MADKQVATKSAGRALLAAVESAHIRKDRPEIKSGDTVLKYGHDVGRAVANIGKGHHVHVHNLKTKRW